MKIKLLSTFICLFALTLFTAPAAHSQTTRKVWLDDTTGASNWNSIAYPNYCKNKNMPNGGGPRPKPICIESISAAITDAYTDFASNPGDTYDIYFSSLATTPTVDLSAATNAYYQSSSAAYINVSPNTYTGTSTLLPTTGSLNIIGSSATTCGSGSSPCSVNFLTDNSIQTMRGYNIQHVHFSYINFERNSTYPNVTEGTLTGTVTQGFTVSMTSGYENLDTFVNRINSYNAGTPNAQGLMRAYLPNTGSGYPTMIDNQYNTQLAWVANTAITGGSNQISCTGTSCTVYFTSSGTTVPSAYTTVISGQTPLVCFKFEGSQSAYDFNDNSNNAGATGTDVGFDNVTWRDAGGGDFRHITNPYVTNSSIIARNPTTDCITHPGGGAQFNRPGDSAIDMGVYVSNFTAHNTGDDTIAIFNDNNGGRTGVGSPGSVITGSTISGSFARDVNLDGSCRVQAYVYGIDGMVSGYNNITNCFSTNLETGAGGPGADFPTYYGACVTDTSTYTGTYPNYYTACNSSGWPTPPL